MATNHESVGSNPTGGSLEEQVHGALDRRRQAFRSCGLDDDLAIEAAKASVFPIEFFRMEGKLELVAAGLNGLGMDICRWQLERAGDGLGLLSISRLECILNAIAMSRI